MLSIAMMSMYGNTRSATMKNAGSGSASSVVRSMKNARLEPQANEKIDTITLSLISQGKWPVGISENKNVLSRQ